MYVYYEINSDLYPADSRGGGEDILGTYFLLLYSYVYAFNGTMIILFVHYLTAVSPAVNRKIDSVCF